VEKVGAEAEEARWTARMRTRGGGRNKDKREKKKIEKEIENKKEKGRALWTFHHLIHLTQPGEAVLPKFFPKRIQLH
jgi:hypothetical protein